MLKNNTELFYHNSDSPLKMQASLRNRFPAQGLVIYDPPKYSVEQKSNTYTAPMQITKNKWL